MKTEDAIKRYFWNLFGKVGKEANDWAKAEKKER